MNYKHYAAQHNRRSGQKPSPIIPVANYSWVNLDIYADLPAFPYSGPGPGFNLLNHQVTQLLYCCKKEDKRAHSKVTGRILGKLKGWTNSLPEARKKDRYILSHINQSLQNYRSLHKFSGWRWEN